MRASDMEHRAQLVAAFAIRMPRREISYELVGLLGYLADRVCLSKHGFPIVDDIRICVDGAAYDYGVMRVVLDGYNPPVRGKAMFIEAGDYSCRLSPFIEDEDIDLLSVATAGVVDDVFRQYAPLGVDGIVALMNSKEQFPELGGKEDGHEVGLADMAVAVGLEDAQGCVDDMESHRRIDRILSIMTLMK